MGTGAKVVAGGKVKGARGTGIDRARSGFTVVSG